MIHINRKTKMKIKSILRLIVTLSICLFLFGCMEDHNKDLTYQTKAVIRNVYCDNSFLNGQQCQTTARYIDGPYRGQTCTNDRMAGAVGDTITISIRIISNYPYSTMR